MRISDWSSDLCSSDLAHAFSLGLHDLARKPLRDFRIDPFVAILAEQVGIDFAAGRNITVLADENGDRVRRFHCLAGDNPADRIGIAVDRKSVVSGKSVQVRLELGGRRIIKKKK